MHRMVKIIFSTLAKFQVLHNELVLKFPFFQALLLFNTKIYTLLAGVCLTTYHKNKIGKV